MTIDTPLCFAIGLTTGFAYNAVHESWILVVGFIAFILLCVVLIRVRMREMRKERIHKVFDRMVNNSEWAQHKHD